MSVIIIFQVVQRGSVVDLILFTNEERTKLVKKVKICLLIKNVRLKYPGARTAKRRKCPVIIAHQKKGMKMKYNLYIIYIRHS